ncbi:CLUMA_CG015895, isoform A [Clunio marinus]|uniref:CLUMA_CG015895, isoform A n=1 Tax=Clunio marinus TaxID=568069 RepID=A0A1J1IVK3_9DIPT|nr:CLUMA_CG015895, isoform A [Clunio marinus]
MSIHLMCLSSSGTPIFTKRRGENVENLPFSTVASLNGVHLFCKTQNVGLELTEFGDNGLVIWKEFESLLFIGISTNLTERVLRNLIEKAFEAMVLHVGLNEIQQLINIDCFKRDLKSSYFQIIEKLMETAENDLLDFNESLLCNESVAIHEKLLTFSEQTFSPYCFVLSRHRLICASEGFYDLHVSDRKLLILLITQSNALQKDFPVFLPHKSPTIAYRLISLPIIQGVSVGLICGAKPAYNELEVLSQAFWQDHYELLVSAEINNPRNFPPTIELDSSVIGFLLINSRLKKYFISKNIQQVVGKRSSHRMDILRAFFHKSVYTEDFGALSEPVKVPEQYYTSDYHKCHALIKDECILCVLFVSAVPTHTMKFISEDLLVKLLSEKSFTL